ncbi:DNA adenine methylase [Ureibacillus sp. FSL K6-2830]|uniref:DNA adenine methylase n=1 Tax=Ureibacillus sp. FSL K6-2830 TaxID=2954610 RepID=UPI0030F63824
MVTLLTLPAKIENFLIGEQSVAYLSSINKVKKLEGGPFVKWAGGKSKLVETILDIVSAHINLNEIEHYIEPFVGGGAMFFYLANRCQFKTYTIIDINLDLINVYRAIKENPILLVKEMDKIQNKYNSFSCFNDKEMFYYEIRDKYNNYANKGNLFESIDFNRAAQFIFLNKSGFNGLYRVNKSGDFNVPFGKKEKIKIYDDKNILKVYELLQKTTIVHGDYRQTADYLKKNTFVYFDPPYRPITNTSSFTAYDHNGFNDEDQVALAQFCMQLYIQGIRFSLSNSDPHNTDPSDDFFDDLYKGFNIYRISAPRQIAAESKSRNRVTEILVVG